MPLFEKESDRINERKVAQELANVLHLAVHITDTTTAYDLYAFYPEDKDKYLFVAEVKCRDCLPNTYPDIFLSKDKREDVEAAAKAIGTTPLFFVKYKNGKIRYFALGADKDFGTPQYQGRTDRGADKDMEMMYNVSNKLMIDLN
jgi:hypothetical protein